MNEFYFPCPHDNNPSECLECKISLLEDTLDVQREMTADLADELKESESRLKGMQCRVEHLLADHPSLSMEFLKAESVAQNSYLVMANARKDGE